jgi:uncharacterized protein YpmB
MGDKILQIIEIILLVWIVIQGEFIRYYERGVFRLHTEREDERRAWRLAKQKSQLKKAEGNATVE